MKQISFQSVKTSQLGAAYPINCYEVEPGITYGSFHSSDLHRGILAAHLPQASARQPRKRNSLKGILGRALACVMVMAIVDVALINFMFFPECNRITHDCFLVQHLWGAK